MKAKATQRAKEPRLKVTANALPKALSVVNSKGKGTREEPVQSAMAPPQSTSVGRVKRQASRTQPSTSISNLSVMAGAATPDDGREEVGSKSESAASRHTTRKLKEVSMKELERISVKAYPNVRAVMNIPLMQKIGNVLEQEFLDALVEKLRFGKVDPAACKVVGQFRSKLPLNEAHSYAYLLQHDDFNVTKKEVRANVKDLRALEYYSYSQMLFENLSAKVDSVHKTMCYVRNCEGFAELVLEIQ